MNKKQIAEKVVSIRTEVVMLCQRVPEEIEKDLEDMIPQIDKIIEDVDKLDK